MINLPMSVEGYLQKSCKVYHTYLVVKVVWQSYVHMCGAMAKMTDVAHLCQGDLWTRRFVGAKIEPRM